MPVFDWKLGSKVFLVEIRYYSKYFKLNFGPTEVNGPIWQSLNTRKVAQTT